MKAQSNAKALKKAPEDMSREELMDALKLSRATVWELQEQVRKLSVKRVDKIYPST